VAGVAVLRRSHVTLASRNDTIIEPNSIALAELMQKMRVVCLNTSASCGLGEMAQWLQMGISMVGWMVLVRKAGTLTAGRGIRWRRGESGRQGAGGRGRRAGR
jgi:hypothetical protein